MDSPTINAFRATSIFRIAAIATLACATCAFAEDKEVAPLLKFSAHTEFVLVPTLVTDKSGSHITGLKKEDFRIFENGSERRVTFFEEVTSKPQRLSRPRNLNEFSNGFDGSQSTRRLTVIVLDLINTPFLDQAHAREDLVKYLAESVDPHEPTALYTLSRNGTHVIHDFTTDPRVLVAALHKLKGDPYKMVDTQQDAAAMTKHDPFAGASPLAGGTEFDRISPDSKLVADEAQLLNALLEEALTSFRAFQERLAITATLDGMQQIAQALAGVPGRKAVIWASGAFPFTVSGTMQFAPIGPEPLGDVMPLYERTWQSLNDAMIALYPVDVRGLQDMQVPPVNRPTWHPISVNRATPPPDSAETDLRATFDTFAESTGGRAYYGSNDLEKGFREAVSDSSQYYMLGYYLDHSKTKPGWRKLSVKVKHQNLKLRFRSALFVANSAANPENARDGDIASALRSPLDFTALQFTAHWDTVKPSEQEGKKRVTYVVTLAPETAPVDTTDNNRMAIEFVAQAKAPEGKPVGQPLGQKIDHHLNPEQLATIREKGISYRSGLDLAPGEYDVRIVVRDNLSGRVGSVTAPLKVE
jgi:VWFA-related protein